MACFTPEAMNCLILSISPFILIYWAAVFYGYYRLRKRIERLKPYERWILAAAVILLFYLMALTLAGIMGKSCI